MKNNIDGIHQRGHEIFGEREGWNNRKGDGDEDVNPVEACVEGDDFHQVFLLNC